MAINERPKFADDGIGFIYASKNGRYKKGYPDSHFREQGCRFYGKLIEIMQLKKVKMVLTGRLYLFRFPIHLLN